MDALKATIQALLAALAAFFDALITVLSPASPTAPPPVEPPPGPEPIKVVIDDDKADKALLYEKIGQDKAGKPILQIWHSQDGKVARFDPGTKFTVFPEPVIATGGMKFWQLYYKPQFYLRADACMKL